MTITKSLVRYVVVNPFALFTVVTVKYKVQHSISVFSQSLSRFSELNLPHCCFVWSSCQLLPVTPPSFISGHPSRDPTP